MPGADVVTIAVFESSIATGPTVGVPSGKRRVDLEIDPACRVEARRAVRDEEVALAPRGWPAAEVREEPT